MSGGWKAAVAVAAVIAALIALSGPPPGEPTQVTIPSGATLSQVADSLSARGVIRGRALFEWYARARRADRKIKSGHYLLATNSSWASTLGSITRGEVVTEPMTIPEGFMVQQMVPRIAEAAGVSPASVQALLAESDLVERLGVPGPGVEGYLFPDTYRFASGVPVSTILETMAERYRAVWTPERLAQLEELGWTERELVTLASIVQAEARRPEEMPRIAGVYHNRLEIGWLLQADPTVIYALGGYRERLLYAAIDSVADNPYNTYRQSGLPPGPISAPGEAAIDAALNPIDDYLFFVARPDGYHVFTRSLAEHNQARIDIRGMNAAQRGS
ncbi:MAG: endolytic transglycosylase MltG [Gemmatimonadota bacterium]|nr:endolytic transglycosylase MltG [Gemmatimonadota bacterium]MDH3422985.1 endolytic transglycosylase MltG [Gemmatimonadota bacterium]